MSSSEELKKVCDAILNWYLSDEERMESFYDKVRNSVLGGHKLTWDVQDYIPLSHKKCSNDDEMV